VADVAAIVAYADRMHRALPDGHAVSSPLGAWLLLALVGPAATSDRERDELTAVLGTDLRSAATTARELLSNPNPVVPSAAAVWTMPMVETPELGRWRDGLPDRVDRGPIPSQVTADAWARAASLDLIPEFPLALGPDTLFVLATALATKVSWRRPFELASSGGLRSERWPALESVLLAKPSVNSQLVRTARAGLVAVHIARADGLNVVSVIADPEVPRADVLAAAHEVAVGAAEPVSLFELPLGEGPAWTITEREAELTRSQEERCSALLPAWSVSSTHQLLGAPSFGFQAANRIVGGLIGSGGPSEAVQVAVARYSRTGFEAAAITGFARRTSGPPPKRPGLLREAELRFAHPFASVAVVADAGSPWDGVPVFAAWITEPENADAPPLPDRNVEFRPPPSGE
jgi:hypothetical protein